MALADELRDNPEKVASLIDHTNVDAAATEDEIRELCDEVREYNFCSAVVVPYHAELANELVGDVANVVAVVGFPYGIQNSEAKQDEVRALLDVCDELDMVMNRTAFANDDHDFVVEDIQAVKDVVGEDKNLKCIIESPTLSQDEITQASKLVKQGGADFVKTAVGYDGPANPEEVQAMREAVGPDMGVKASGGIHSFEEALEMVEAGATRIGASSGVQIFESIEDWR